MPYQFFSTMFIFGLNVLNIFLHMTNLQQSKTSPPFLEYNSKSSSIAPTFSPNTQKENVFKASNFNYSNLNHLSFKASSIFPYLATKHTQSEFSLRPLTTKTILT
jgi:hypothetical protein